VTKQKPPAFQFYVKDWLSSPNVMMMTPEQRGCYIQLLAFSWPNGIHMPGGMNRALLGQLAGIADSGRWDEISTPVLAQFEVETDARGDVRLAHPKLKEQYKSLDNYHKMQQDKAKKGADARWHRAGMVRALPEDASASETDSSNSYSVQNISGGVPDMSWDFMGNRDVRESQSSQLEPKPKTNLSVVSQFQTSVHFSSAQEASREALSEWSQRMVLLWRDLRQKVGYKGMVDHLQPEHFWRITNSERWQQSVGIKAPSRQEVEDVIVWALTKSRRKTHPKDWGNPGVLDGSEGFMRAFPTISTQYFNYQSEIKLKERNLGKIQEGSES